MTAALQMPRTFKYVVRAEDAHAAFPTPVLQRYAAKFELSMEDARLHARELVRYFAMSAENPDSDYGMAGQVDEVWHEFLMFTIDYDRWCHETFGYFIHHIPTTPQEKEEMHQGDAPDTYELFYRDYPLYYGEEPPAIWPVPHSLTAGCGGGGGSSCGGSSCSSSSCNSSSCNSSSCKSSCNSSSCSTSNPQPSTQPRPQNPIPPRKRRRR